MKKTKLHSTSKVADPPAEEGTTEEGDFAAWAQSVGCGPPTAHERITQEQWKKMDPAERLAYLAKEFNDRNEGYGLADYQRRLGSIMGAIRGRSNNASGYGPSPFGGMFTPKW
jgi:hypothetical protein